MVSPDGKRGYRFKGGKLEELDTEILQRRGLKPPSKNPHMNDTTPTTANMANAVDKTGPIQSTNDIKSPSLNYYRFLKPSLTTITRAIPNAIATTESAISTDIINPLLCIVIIPHLRYYMNRGWRQSIHRILDKGVIVEVIPFWGALMIFGTFVIPLYIVTREVEKYSRSSEK